jgi:hypothetical protein
LLFAQLAAYVHDPRDHDHERTPEQLVRRERCDYLIPLIGTARDLGSGRIVDTVGSVVRLVSY